jgi:hypothetical protein
MISTVVQSKIGIKALLESMQEWGDFMKTSSSWTDMSIVVKIMMGLVLVALLSGGINAVPAFGKDDRRDMGRHDNKDMRKHDNRRYEHRGAGYDRDVHGRRDYRPYGYAPPPVIYAPTPPSGIGIFFPPIIIRR